LKEPSLQAEQCAPRHPLNYSKRKITPFHWGVKNGNLREERFRAGVRTAAAAPGIEDGNAAMAIHGLDVSILSGNEPIFALNIRRVARRLKNERVGYGRVAVGRSYNDQSSKH
jgi:hypothetical protein